MGNRKKLYYVMYRLLRSEDIDVLKTHNTYDILCSVLGLGYFVDVRNVFSNCGYKIDSMSDRKRWRILEDVVEKCVNDLIGGK